VEPEVIAAGSFDAVEAFGIWLRSLVPPEPCWALLERVPVGWVEDAGQGIRLERWQPDLSFEPYRHGCVFCSSFEIRWEISLDRVAVRYAGIVAGPLAPLEIKRPVLPEPRETVVALWGDRVEGVQAPPGEGWFASLRIPRMHRYPIQNPGAQRVSLRVLEYRSPDNGDTLLWRCAEVVQE